MHFSIEHVGLPARDPAALREWYLAMLGAECLAPAGAAPPFFVRLAGSSLMLEIYLATGPSAATADNGLAGWRHLALRVDSLDAARQELEARGVKFPDSIKPAAGGGRVLFFQDLEGNLLHLLERPADSAVR